jgi:thymidine kinase
MNAGKSTALLQVAHNYEEQGQNVFLYTAAIDHRYGVGKVTSGSARSVMQPPLTDSLIFSRRHRMSAAFWSMKPSS